LAIILFTLFLLAAPALAQGRDPVVSDPSVTDRRYPPGYQEILLPSAGTRLNGFLYRAQGAGPHPTIILLHGFPGHERNLDLAQAFRRAGYDVLVFDYRGSWGSGGSFSFANAREDVVSAIDFMSDAGNARKYRIDPGRLILIGHSFGGWLTLAAMDTARVACAVALAPWNIGRWGAMIRDGKVKREDAVANTRSVTDPEAGPMRGTTAEALVDEEVAHAADWDFAALAPSLRHEPILVIATSQDERDDDMRRAPLDSALAPPHGTTLTSIGVDDDHGFSAHRIWLARTVVRWLAGHCFH
jgi:pimeloyl-ACP methyl ester carboxylesterase